MISFGRNLKKTRLFKKMTQQDLSQKVGVTKSVISAYESSRRYPSLETLVSIAGVLNVSTDFLLGIRRASVLDISGLTNDQVQIVVKMVDLFQSKDTVAKTNEHVLPHP